jgi:RNA polymerase sigma-70 factor (ECF subfamily)
LAHPERRWYRTSVHGEELRIVSGAPPDERVQAAEDAALMSAVAGGDRQALARLYDRHAGALLAVGLRMLAERGQAEDLVHDVFLEAWHHAADFDADRGSVRAWLVVRLRSRALDRLASAARRARLDDEATRQATDRAAAPASGADSERVRGQVAALTPDLAAVIDLAFFDGLTSTEIAQRLGIPVGTVKSRMARALGALKQRLGPAGGRP